MDVALIVRNRLKELGLEQKDLALAAQVTESYISQLLARKKLAPAPGRTQLYEKMGAFLRLPVDELSKLADHERREGQKKRVGESPGALFQDCRELILRKCAAGRQAEVRRIFEKDPFGEFERLVTQQLFEVAKGTAEQEQKREGWLQRMAQANGRSCEEAQRSIVDCLGNEVFTVSIQPCVSLVDALVESWDVDLKTFAMSISLNSDLSQGGFRRIEFVQTGTEAQATMEPGLAEFLRDSLLSGDATYEEIRFLKSLRLGARQPTAIYYYRELQNLRDPLHFRL